MRPFIRMPSGINIFAGMALLLAAPLVGASAAQACRYLEMQMMQLQAGGIQPGEESRAEAIQSRLARDGCRGGRVAAKRIKRIDVGPQVAAAIPGTRWQKTGAVIRYVRGPHGGQATAESDTAAHALSYVETASAGSLPAHKVLRKPDFPHFRDLQLAPSVPRGREETYATMCVRTCDGYYFPISYSTPRRGLYDDASACSRRCPGTSTKLFFHNPLSESPAQMQAFNGELYSELPNAYKHLTSFNPSCTCRSSWSTVSYTKDTETSVERETQSERGFPQSRPMPGEDPESIANSLGGLGIEELRTSKDSLVARSGSEIRVVGGVDQTVTLLRPLN